MTVHEFTFQSANQRDAVRAWAYSPLGQPKAIIQLIHGFCEHSGRYLRLITALTDAGFCVYADDHIGHGRTAWEKGTLGNPHSGGFLTYVRDEKSLHDIAVSEYPGIPFTIFGHSWGSMLARCYAALYGEDITAVLLSGVCSQMAGCEKTMNDPLFTKAYEENRYQSAGIWSTKVFCGMTDRIHPIRTPMDWLAVDSRVIDEHNADPYIVRENTLEMLYDLVQAYRFTQDPQWAASVPSCIPFYLIGGDQDPCGNYGEGVYYTANLLAEAGHRVQVKLYPGYRHEVYHDPDIQDDVAASIIAFLSMYLPHSN